MTSLSLLLPKQTKRSLLQSTDMNTAAQSASGAFFILLFNLPMFVRWQISWQILPSLPCLVPYKGYHHPLYLLEGGLLGGEPGHRHSTSCSWKYIIGQSWFIKFEIYLLSTYQVVQLLTSGDTRIKMVATLKYILFGVSRWDCGALFCRLFLFSKQILSFYDV